MSLPEFRQLFDEDFGNRFNKYLILSTYFFGIFLFIKSLYIFTDMNLFYEYQSDFLYSQWLKSFWFYEFLSLCDQMGLERDTSSGFELRSFYFISNKFSTLNFDLTFLITQMMTFEQSHDFYNHKSSLIIHRFADSFFREFWLFQIN